MSAELGGEDGMFQAVFHTYRELKFLQNPHLLRSVIDTIERFSEERDLKFQAFVILPNRIEFIAKTAVRQKIIDLKKRLGLKVKYWLQNNDPVSLDRARVRRIDRVHQIWEDKHEVTVVNDHESLTKIIHQMHETPCLPEWGLAEDCRYYPFSSASYYATGSDPFGFLQAANSN